MSTGEAPTVARLLERCYATVTGAAASASDAELRCASGCGGWSAAELLVHLLADARRALVTFATPEQGPPDTDAVSYWRRSLEATDIAERSGAHARHVRGLAAAYSRPASIVQEWRDTAAAASRAAVAADPEGLVGTQGCVLTVEDFIETLVVESTIHQLDFAVALPAALPSGAELALTARTLSTLATVELPSNWSDLELIRKVTGREPLSDAERATFGEQLPLRL
jgi:hypothetical protein